MTICIIDDEKSNRDILKYIIHQIDESINIVGEAENVYKGIQLINQTKPDLIFLDIEMPDGTGFELINQLDIHHPEIIFCTAYNQFGLKAIECSALAYVLKPIIKTNISDALQKAIIKVSTNNKLMQYEILNEQLKNQTKEKARFVISNSDKLHVVYVEDVICCIAHSNYTDIHLIDNKRITVSKTLKEIESILHNYEQFCRIHQSNIINTLKISKLIKTDGNLIVKLTNNMDLAVSRSKKDELISKLS